MTNVAPTDPGLQPERTALSWRRTCLSIMVGSLVGARLLPELLGSAWWAVLGLVGGAFSGLLWAAVERRGHVAARQFATGRAMPGARPLAALTVFALAFAAVGLAVLFVA